MTVHELLSQLGGAAPAGDVFALPAGAGLEMSCARVTSDSRRVIPGTLFVALKGLKDDGARFAADAERSGALAVVSDRPIEGLRVPVVIVADARLALARLAAAFYQHPSEQLRLVGITGTNGKTTTGYLLHAIFEAAGIRSGLMGTVTYRIGDRVVEATRTTPDAVEVQQMLREMVSAGCTGCVMEVSSHALALHRVDGLRFAAGIFTNLTRDHLDFHADMEDYFAAKRRLFEMLPPDAPAVINTDDPRGASLVGVVPRAVSYGINKPADISPGPLTYSVDGLSFDIRSGLGDVRVRSRLVGKPNVYNILAAVGTALALGIAPDAIERGLASLPGVPGRFELVHEPGDGLSVIVDYAHTDDALRNLLETARPLAARRLITVFGAGGDRDRSKRPLMGMVAARLSDLVVITSDNPRSEDPDRIIEDVRRGAGPEERRGARVVAITDRREAIEHAIAQATDGDMVLIAGKGHEKYQEAAGRVTPFDDVAVAREALRLRRTRKAG